MKVIDLPKKPEELTEEEIVEATTIQNQVGAFEFLEELAMNGGVTDTIIIAKTSDGDLRWTALGTDEYEIVVARMREVEHLIHHQQFNEVLE